jgi:hypothetical protein
MVRHHDGARRRMQKSVGQEVAYVALGNRVEGLWECFG